MRVSKAMPKTPAKGSSGKRSKALPFVDAPDGLKESQDGCTFGLATTAPAAEGAWTEQRKDGRGDGGEEKGGRMGGRDAGGGKGMEAPSWTSLRRADRRAKRDHSGECH